MGERKQKILAAVLDTYIRTGEPVGSKAVVDLLDNSVSSATVRNDMAELAMSGYLEQPHTSAGRIPTAKAFRLYIDHLMKRHPLSVQDCHEIDELLSGYAGDPERLIGEASQALAAATGLATVSTMPLMSSDTVHRVELLQVSSRTVVLLLLTGMGMLRSRLCRFEIDMDVTVLVSLVELLTCRFGEQPLAEIGLAQVQSLLSATGERSLFCMPVLSAFYELVQEAAEADVTLTGQLNLLHHPDYEMERARTLLSFLNRRQSLLEMLALHADGLHVLIGNESLRPELTGSSVIVTHYSPGKRMDGTMGIIGPIRMDYATAIPRLEYFAKTVSRLLHDLLEE